MDYILLLCRWQISLRLANNITPELLLSRLYASLGNPRTVSPSL